MPAKIGARVASALVAALLVGIAGCTAKPVIPAGSAWEGPGSFVVIQEHQGTREELRLFVLPAGSTVTDAGRPAPAIWLRVDQRNHSSLVFAFSARDLSFISTKNTDRNLTYFIKDLGPLAPGQYAAAFSFLLRFALEPEPSSSLGLLKLEMQAEKDNMFDRTDCQPFSITYNQAEPVIVCLTAEGTLRSAARKTVQGLFVYSFEDYPRARPLESGAAGHYVTPDAAPWGLVRDRSGKELAVPPTGFGADYDLNRYVVAAATDEGMNQRGIATGTYLHRAAWNYRDQVVGLVRPEFQALPTKMGAVYFSAGGRQSDLINVESVRVGSESNERVVASTPLSLILDLPRLNRLPTQVVPLARVEEEYLHLLPQRPTGDGPSPDRRWWIAYEHVAPPDSPAALQWLLSEGCLTRAGGKHEPRANLTFLVVSAVTGRLLVLGKADTSQRGCAYEYASDPPQYQGPHGADQ